MRRVFLPVLVVAALAAGCKKPHKKSSPEYAAAQARFVVLYADKLDDAYKLPEMDDLLGQLERVPADSLDAQVAAELAKRIREGRVRAVAEEAARAKAAAEATAPPVMPSVGRVAPATAEPAAVAEQQDAGTEDGAPKAGMTAREFDEKFGTCFAPGAPVKVSGQGTAESRLLNDRVQCQKRLPGFDKQAVLFKDGKVMAVIDRSAYEAVVPHVTVEKRAVPVDGGTPPPAPAK